MRSDMKHVIRKSNRSGSKCSFKDLRFDKDYQFSIEGDSISDMETDSRYRESMHCRAGGCGSSYRRSCYMSTRVFGTFLASQVDRNWDDVYSDISKLFKNDDHVEHTIKLAIDWYIERDVKMNAHGLLYTGHDSSNLISKQPYTHLYIHPQTNILMLNDAYKYGRQKYGSKKPEVLNEIQIGRDTYLVQKKGIWYEVRYAKQKMLSCQTTKNSAPPYNDYYFASYWNKKKNKPPCPRKDTHVQVTDIIDTVVPKYAKDVFGKDAIKEDGALVAVHRRNLNYRQLKKYNLADYGLNND